MSEKLTAHERLLAFHLRYRHDVLRRETREEILRVTEGTLQRSVLELSIALFGLKRAVIRAIRASPMSPFPVSDE